MREAAAFFSGVGATVLSLWCAKRCSDSDSLTTDGGVENGPTTPDSPDIRPCLREGLPQIRMTPSLEKSQDPDGNKVINQYTIVSSIGKGTFSTVKLAFHNETDEPFAVKVIRKDSVRRGASIARELSILQKTKHKNIVTTHEIINDSNSTNVYFVLEYVSGGAVASLDSRGVLKGPVFPNHKIKPMLIDVTAGLGYLHSLSIVHRDIKPENLLVARDGTVKITDFGVSATICHLNRNSRLNHGTPAYDPPECGWSVEQRLTVPDTAVDTWGLGMTLYALKFGKLPHGGQLFRSKSLPDMSGAIRSIDITFPSGEDDGLTSIVRALLAKNPHERATISDLCKLNGYLSPRGDG